MLALVFALAGAQAQTVIKFSHVVAENTPKGQAALKFKELAEKKLPGKVEVQVFPSSQLFGDAKELEALLLGDVQFIAPSLSKFDRYTKKLQVFDLPFLFDDVEAVDRFQAGAQGKALLESMRSRGLARPRLLAQRHEAALGQQGVLSARGRQGAEVPHPGVRRARGAVPALGANPQKMAFAEVYQALQTGVVDGQENTWSNIYSQKFFEVQKTIAETNHGVIDYMVVDQRQVVGRPARRRAEGPVGSDGRSDRVRQQRSPTTSTRATEADRRCRQGEDPEADAKDDARRLAQGDGAGVEEVRGRHRPRPDRRGAEGQQVAALPAASRHAARLDALARTPRGRR